MFKIIPKKFEDKIELKIEDNTNNLGLAFTISKEEFESEDGLEKTFNFIADYVNQNYKCLHERRNNGLQIVDTKNVSS